MRRCDGDDLSQACYCTVSVPATSEAVPYLARWSTRVCEALRILQASLPPGHQHVADAQSRARRLEQV